MPGSPAGRGSEPHLQGHCRTQPKDHRERFTCRGQCRAWRGWCSLTVGNGNSGPASGCHGACEPRDFSSQKRYCFHVKSSDVQHWLDCFNHSLWTRSNRSQGPSHMAQPSILAVWQALARAVGPASSHFFPRPLQPGFWSQGHLHSNRTLPHQL